MKFIIPSALAVLCMTSIQASSIKKREERYETGSVNGTWYLTGMTESAWTIYQVLTESYTIDCIQLGLSSSTNGNLDAIASGFLHKTEDVGLNVTGAGLFVLDEPTGVNVSDHQAAWHVYGSELFANGGQWANFTGGQTVEDNSSVTIPGSKPFEIKLSSKWIDSDSDVGKNDSSQFDTLFLWGQEIKFLESTKRAEEVYGLLFSKSSLVDEDKFNKTLTLLPQHVVDNKIPFVKLNDTCS